MSFKNLLDLEVETPKGSSFNTVMDLGSDVVETAGDIAESVGGAVETGLDFVQSAGEGVLSFLDTVTDENFGTSQARAYMKNLINPGSELTADMLNDEDRSALAEVVSNARAAGRDYLTYADYGTSNSETLEKGLKTSFTDPKARIGHLVGSGGKIYVDEEGNTIVEDLYDFNPGKKRVAFWEGLKEGSVDMDLISDANPIELLSMLAYAAQEQRKSKGRASDSKIVFNLGKLED